MRIDGGLTPSPAPPTFTLALAVEVIPDAQGQWVVPHHVAYALSTEGPLDA